VALACINTAIFGFLPGNGLSSSVLPTTLSHPPKHARALPGELAAAWAEPGSAALNHRGDNRAASFPVPQPGPVH